MVQIQNFLFHLFFMVVLGGMTTPILFQWFVNRNVLIGALSIHGIIISICTSLLLVLVYIHSRGFICSMHKIKRIILVKTRPILLSNIIKKSCPQTKSKNTFILFLISYFHFLIFKFISDFSYLKSFCSVLCFLLSCIFPLSTNYRHDRLANKEHISLEWKELNYVSMHKEESAKHFGLMKKEAKMKRDTFFCLRKEKKSKI